MYVTLQSTGCMRGFPCLVFPEASEVSVAFWKGVGGGGGGRRGGSVGGGKNQMFTRFHVAVPAAAVDMWPLALGVLEF